MSARTQDDDFGEGNAAFAQRLHCRQRLAAQATLVVVRAERRELAHIGAARLDYAFRQIHGVDHIDDGARRTEVVVTAHGDCTVEIETLALIETLRLILEQIESPVFLQLRQQARDPLGVEVLPFVDDHEVVQRLEVLRVTAVAFDDRLEDALCREVRLTLRAPPVLHAEFVKARNPRTRRCDAADVVSQCPVEADVKGPLPCGRRVVEEAERKLRFSRPRCRLDAHHAGW